MSNEPVAPETKGVTAQLLAMVDLGPEIEGMAGRQLRMRLVTFEPGGVFGPMHDHIDRPGIVYILQGTITDHRNGVATEYGPGVGWPEDKNTLHWLENRGTSPALEISVDIVRQEQTRPHAYARRSPFASELATWPIRPLGEFSVARRRKRALNRLPQSLNRWGASSSRAVILAEARLLQLCATG